MHADETDSADTTTYEDGETDDTSECVTLKVAGKKYRCASRPSGGAGGGRALCKSAEFYVTEAVGGHAGLLRLPAFFTCAVCHHIPDLTGRVVEAKLPPRNDWRTPGGSSDYQLSNGLWSTLHREYRFTVDAAADTANAKCPVWFGPTDATAPNAIRDLPTGANALLTAWFGAGLVDRAEALGVFHFGHDPSQVRVFWNPPYNPLGSIATWLARAIEQAARGVFSVGLLPMATSPAWFNDLVVPYAEWHSFRGRIEFEDPTPGAKRTSPKQDNLLVIFDPRSRTIGHAAVRDAKTGARLWTRPDLLAHHTDLDVPVRAAPRTP